MSNSLQQPIIRRVGRAILFGLFCVALVAWLIYLALNMGAKRAWVQYEQQEEAKGEHFSFTDFIPKSMPDASNFAFTPIVASSYEGILDKNGHEIIPRTNDAVSRLNLPIYGGEPSPPTIGDWALGKETDLKAFQIYYRTPIANVNVFPVSANPQSPAADVLLALSKYDQTIEELRQAAALPDSRFPLNYDCNPPAGILLPHLAVFKKCSQTLELRAIAELRSGQSDKALADIKLTFRLMASVRNEPFLVSHLARIDMLKLALQPVWEGIQEHLWENDQLQELNENLAELDFLADYESSVRCGRALDLADIEYMRRTRDIGVFLGGGNVIPTVSEIELRFAANSVYYDNERIFAQACQEWMLPIADAERHNVSLGAVRLASTNLDRMRLNWSLDNGLAAMLLPAFEKCAQRYSYAQSSVDMARVACALERCRLAQGKYPESLNPLAPNFIESVPPDVIGGQPLKYHPTDDGHFVLYSVGWNGTDDGGAVFVQAKAKTLIDYDDGDWVWPYLPD